MSNARLSLLPLSTPTLVRALAPAVALLASFGIHTQARAADPCTQQQLDDALARYNGTVLADGAQADAASVDSCYAAADIVTFTWNANSSMTAVCFDDLEGCNIRVLQGSAASPDVWGIDGREDDGTQSYYHVWSAAITDLSIIGSAADDWISSLHGMSSATPSRVAAGGGNDIVLTGSGDDVIRAGGGDDTVFAGAGDDYVRGSNGNDWIDVGIGFDLVEGGNDVDYVFGGGGDDSLLGESGADIVYGEGGADLLDGGGDDDIVGGGGGADTGTGQWGNDLVMGQAEADDMLGGEGDDVMIGGGGLDNMDGENGGDWCAAETQTCESSVPNRVAVVAAYDGLELDHQAHDAAILAAAGSFSSTVFSEVASERAAADAETASFYAVISGLIVGFW